jgi:hypothetical protein
MTVGCGQRSSGGEPFAVRRIRVPEVVFLNQELTVTFSEPVDALSVTPDTVRVVDDAGHAVPWLRREVGSKLVRLYPRAPVTAGLDDGSFVPGRTYWLEIAGYPQINAVRARGGSILRQSVRVPIPVVGREGTRDYPRPLHYAPGEHEPFALDLGRPPQVQLESGLLTLHFTLPPFPPSVRPQAFIIQRFGTTLQRVEVTTARIARDPVRQDAGVIVELQLRADPAIKRGDYLALVLADGPDAVLDYAGRAVSAAFGSEHGPDRGPWQIAVHSDTEHGIARIMASDSPVLEPQDLATPGFDVRDRSRIVPLVRRAAGSGVHGVLRPPESWRLGPGEALALAQGRVVRADATLELAALDIPAGVRLTIGGFTEPVRILISGAMRIAGEVVLETPRDPVPLFPDAVRQVQEDNLDGLAGCVFVVAGDIEVSGRVEHVHERAAMGPALALVCGGRLQVSGRIPRGTVCASEGDFVGGRQAAQVLPVRLRPGWGGLSAATAVAATRWLRVPPWVQGPLLATAVRADPGVEVFWQTAPASALDPSAPDPSRETWSTLQPLSEPLVGGDGLFVRFQLRAPIVPQADKLPGLDGVILHER